MFSTSFETPTETSYLRLDYRQSLSSSSGTLPLPPLKDKEVLIKVFAAPLSAMDLSRLPKGDTNNNTVGPILGMECSGIVVDVASTADIALIGKKVACLSEEGTFRQYLVIPAAQILVLDEEMDLEQASGCFVAPLVTLGLMEEIEKTGAKTIVNTAATSNIGKTMIRLCQLKNIVTINVIRNYDKMKELRDIGAEHILVTSDSDFEARLTELCTKLQATLALDAIGGSVSGIIMRSLLPKSEIITYGNMACEPAVCDPSALRNQKKVWKGFSMIRWYKEKKQEKKNKLAEYIKTKFESTFKFEVAGKYGFGNFNDALTAYKKGVSTGKFLIMPDF
jgi:NADPH:quinone reductase-like Zn-dependent oxidoreductase